MLSFKMPQTEKIKQTYYELLEKQKFDEGWLEYFILEKHKTTLQQLAAD